MSPPTRKERLVFITRQAGSWFKETADSPVSKETRRLLNSPGINGGRNFYCLRHTFRTFADEAKDNSACNVIMGHEDGHVSDRYNERGRIKLVRLQAVANHVREWLWPADNGAATMRAGGGL